MKKYKLLLCMLLMAVTVTACGNKNAESPSDVPASEDVADKEDEETDVDEEDDESQVDEKNEGSQVDEKNEGSQADEEDETIDFTVDLNVPDLLADPESAAEHSNPYTGLTLEDVLDEGFALTGYMAFSSGSSNSISICLSRGIEQLTITMNVDDKTYEEFNALYDTDSKGEYFADLFGACALTYFNSRIDYSIYSSGNLQTAVEMGIYVPFEDAQGKTIGALLEDGYKYISESYAMDDCMITMSKDNVEYIMLIDLSEKDEELDLFWGDGEELLQDYTVVEGYMFKVS